MKSSINFTIRKDLNLDTLENLSLEIQEPSCKPFVFVTWYRLPDSPIGIFSSFRNFNWETSLRTEDVSPRSSPLRDAKRPSAAMSEEKRLPFAGYWETRL